MAFVDNIHYVDDKLLGYRFGYFFWLSLYIVNVVVLSVDSTTGPQREYLTNTSLMSVLTLVYYSYNQFKGNPASVPGLHAAGAEALARLLYAAHLVVAGLFGVSKLGETIHTLWNPNVYLEYVQRQKDAGVR